MGTGQVKGLLEEETSELRWEREERGRHAQSRWTDSTKDLGIVCRDLRVQDTRLGGDKGGGQWGRAGVVGGL